jgi:hypothetical protein
VIKGGMEQYLTPMGPTKLHVNPIFEISPLEPRYSGEGASFKMITYLLDTGDRQWR